MRQQRALRGHAQLLLVFQEVLGERQDVLLALGERRHLQLDDVEPVVQVLAKTSGRDGRRQVGVGRADHAHFHATRGAAAQALELAGLQHAQQLGLALQREIADLVEEQRAAVGRLETSLAHFGRARVGAGFGAEQLGLHQILRQRADVDLDERTAAHARVRLDDRRQHFLAGAVRPGDEHGHVGGGNVRGLRDHIAHRLALEHEPAQVELLRQRGARLGTTPRRSILLDRQAPQLQQIADRRQQSRIVPGLRDIVRGAGLDEIDRRFEMRPGREQHDRHRRIALADGMEQRNALLARRGLLAEVHVLQDEVDLLLRERAQAFVRHARGEHAMPLQRKQHFERRPHGVVVVDD